MRNIEFEDLVLQRGLRRVVWEYIGEGLCGDYDPMDPDDVPLLRFTCYQRLPSYDEKGDEQPYMEYWEQLDDASYCTRMPVYGSTLQMLVKGAAIILEAIESDESSRKRLEELSWFCPEDLAD